MPHEGKEFLLFTTVSPHVGQRSVKDVYGKKEFYFSKVFIYGHIDAE